MEGLASLLADSLVGFRGMVKGTALLRVLELVALAWPGKGALAMPSKPEAQISCPEVAPQLWRSRKFVPYTLDFAQDLLFILDLIEGNLVCKSQCVFNSPAKIYGESR